MPSREEIDHFFGDPSFALEDDDAEVSVCECGHGSIFHVDLSAPLGMGHCSHGGCTCTQWREVRDGI